MQTINTVGALRKLLSGLADDVQVVYWEVHSDGNDSYDPVVYVEKNHAGIPAVHIQREA